MQLYKIMNKERTIFKRCIFTLLELLVVIAIIAILASLLLPALRNARETGKAVSCTGRERQLALGVMQYVDVCNGYLPISDASGVGSWRCDIYPMLYNTSAESFTALRSLVCAKNSIFWCPSFSVKPESSSFYPTGYGWNWAKLGYDAVTAGFKSPPRWQLSKVRNPAGCIMLGDTSDYTSPAYTPCYLYNVNIGSWVDILKVDMGTRHKKLNMTFCDGHVAAFSRDELISRAEELYVP